MDKRKIEFYVGLFVLIGIACFLALYIVLGDINVGKAKRYHLHAYFSSVSGLKPGARIEMAGVEIGTVESVGIDKKRLAAKVSLSIHSDIELTEDSIASIKTAGIIGQKYIDISSGGSEIMLEPGDEIFNTESALDVENLIRQLIFSKDKK